MADIEVKEVFLSHSVASTGKYATELSDQLRAKGYSTFICTQMEPGDPFRESITKNAAFCKLVVVFMDENWAKSGECTMEYNVSVACWNKWKKPKIVALVIGGFEWTTKYTSSLNVTCNFQCVPKVETQSWSEPFARVIKTVEATLGGAAGLLRMTQQHGTPFLEFVTCEMCGKEYTEPLLLPCNHTFCRACLEAWEGEPRGETLRRCTKCHTPCLKPVSELQPDVKANKFLHSIRQANDQGLANDAAKTLDEPANSSKGGYECEQQLGDWFAKNNIPDAAVKLLIEQGFDCLDTVLEMSESEMHAIGMKPGHVKKLLKCIANAPPPDRPPATADESDEMTADPMERWGLVEQLHDARVLSSGTAPNDAVRFWAGLGALQFESVVAAVGSMGAQVERDVAMAGSGKCTCLQQVAMVLSEAGSAAEAERLARSAVACAETPSQEYEAKVLLVYVWDCAVAEDETPYLQLNDLCEDVVRNGHLISEEKLCKVLIKKSMTCYSALKEMKKRDLDDGGRLNREAEHDISKARLLARKTNNKGLEVAALMAVLLHYDSGPRYSNDRLDTLMQLFRLCLGVYGEFSVMTAEIYAALSEVFQGRDERQKAYECSRRTWLIYRQLYGPHHPTTELAASKLADEFNDEARAQGDSLPGDQGEGPNERDRKFRERVPFLYDDDVSDDSDSE